VDPKAFDWQREFADETGAGGFDVVVGNPPYVRQELLSPIKPHLEGHFASYHGMADLYVYFYELGLRLLKPGGRLSLVVTNKWLKAGYAEPLRKHLAEAAWVESLVDFGHAKQIFEDADVFPCILVAKKPAPDQQRPVPRVAVIPREQLRIDDLTRQIESDAQPVAADQFGASAWSTEPPGTGALLAKLAASGQPLRQHIGSRPLFGIKTGFNEAFVIDTATRDAIVAAHRACSELIRPYLRGQDSGRWQPEWARLWMGAAPRQAAGVPRHGARREADGGREGGGIGWQLARTWTGDRNRERQLKNQGGKSRMCPLCGVQARKAA
jgi:hypothetical protein